MSSNSDGRFHFLVEFLAFENKQDNQVSYIILVLHVFQCKKSKSIWFDSEFFPIFWLLIWVGNNLIVQNLNTGRKSLVLYFKGLIFLKEKKKEKKKKILEEKEKEKKKKKTLLGCFITKITVICLIILINCRSFR